MSYRVLVLRKAQKELADLPQDAYQRVVEALRTLEQDARPKGALKMSGRAGWRIRVGRYRVLYEVEDDTRTVLVLHVGHRKDVYD